MAQEHLDNSLWIYCLSEWEGGGRSREVVSDEVLGVGCTQNSAAVGDATGFSAWNNPVLAQLCTARPADLLELLLPWLLLIRSVTGAGEMGVNVNAFMLF